MKRIVDHDGRKDGEGGLASWLRLAEGAGLDRAEVESLESVLPEVRKVCDAYVALVQERSLVEAVAASLTEFFAPDLMAKRLAAWKKYYPWVDHQALDYFERRVRQARKDSGEALQFVLRGAGTRALQDACIRALVDKCTILWSMLDAISTHYRE